MKNNFEYIQYNRIQILLKILKLLVFVISMYSIIRLSQHNYSQALFDIIYVLAGIFSYYTLYKNPQRYIAITRFIFFSSILISIFVLVNVHNSPMRFLWVATIIYTIFYLFDRKEGIFWTLYVVILLFSIILYNPNLLGIKWVDFIILITNIIVVTSIANWYAKIEKESTQRFIEAKNMLTKEVENKTALLKAKTLELQELNNTLEKRIAQKIEENRKHEEILFKQAKFAQIGEMINMIAHQWRQPLNAISATNVSLRVKLDENKTIEKKVLIEKLDRMANYIQDLSKTIDDFRLTYNENIHIDKINIKDIMDNVIELFKNDLIYHNITIKKEYKCELTLELYRNEFTQVLINIIKNAEEALLVKQIKNPQIKLQTLCDQKFVYISIQDNAGGIEPSIIDKIFDPYFTTKSNLNGTGLGLYMSKIIIYEKLKGSFWVESKDGVTTFYIKIPK